MERALPNVWREVDGSLCPEALIEIRCVFFPFSLVIFVHIYVLIAWIKYAAS